MTENMLLKCLKLWYSRPNHCLDAFCAITLALAFLRGITCSVYHRICPPRCVVSIFPFSAFHDTICFIRDWFCKVVSIYGKRLGPYGIIGSWSYLYALKFRLKAQKKGPSLDSDKYSDSDRYNAAQKGCRSKELYIENLALLLLSWKWKSAQTWSKDSEQTSTSTGCAFWVTGLPLPMKKTRNLADRQRVAKFMRSYASGKV